MTCLLGHLAAGHADEQPDELGRLVQVEVPHGRAGEEAGEDRLADVHRVEDPPQRGVAQPQPGADLNADLGFVTADEVLGRALVALADRMNSAYSSRGVDSIRLAPSMASSSRDRPTIPRQGREGGHDAA
jgi:hypothetical protein